MYMTKLLIIAPNHQVRYRAKSKWAVSQVIADGHFNLPLLEFVLV